MIKRESQRDSSTIILMTYTFHIIGTFFSLLTVAILFAFLLKLITGLSIGGLIHRSIPGLPGVFRLFQVFRLRIKEENLRGLVAVLIMPKVKTNRVQYPQGWELIEPTLNELQAKMREAENDPNDNKRKCEALWPIFKVAHQKSRYVFDLYHRRNEISKELYEFCMDQGYADRNLIAKWKKPGYERLCCLRCIQPRDHNFQTTCVCRVPKHLREEKVIECVHCGCKGCASGD